MPRVIKPDQVRRTGGVVLIPDTVPPAPEGEEERGEELELPQAETEAVGEPETEPEEAPPAPDPGQVMRDVIQSNLSSAEEVSRRVMAVARLEREKLLEQTQGEVLELRREAREAGRREGLAQCTSWVEEALAEVDRALEEMREQQRRYFEDYERELKYLALDIAGKIMGKALSADSTELAALVRQAVATVKNVDWIQVEVSDHLVTLIHQLRKEFARENGKQIEVVPKSIPPDSCVVHTSEGILDASVPRQLENLRSLFEKMDDGQ